MHTCGFGLVYEKNVCLCWLLHALHSSAIVIIIRGFAKRVHDYFISKLTNIRPHCTGRFTVPPIACIKATRLTNEHA